MPSAKGYYIASGFPLGHWLLSKKLYKTKAEAAKEIAKKLGYPQDFKDILSYFRDIRDSTVYAGSDKTEVQYRIHPNGTCDSITCLCSD